MKITKQKEFLIRLDRNTFDHLKFISKDFGMDYTNTIRVLINNEHRYIVEHNEWEKKLNEMRK